MHSKHLGFRSNRLGLRKPTPEQSLGASDLAKLPGKVDARSSLLLHNHNLGIVRAACPDKRSHKSLHRASSKRLAMSFPSTIGIALASRKRSLAEQPHPEHLALGEEARPKLPEENPPSPQLDLVSAWVCGHELSQLRAEIATLQEAVRQLAGQSFSKTMAETNTNNNNNNNNNTDNNNNNNTNITTTTTTTTTTTATTITQQAKSLAYKA